jgi:cob(I)alamin adenosyltransferase
MVFFGLDYGKFKWGTKMKQGLIQVYTGDGKGKTTAAMGQAVRAWGRGLKVKVYQFLKAPGGSGEERSLMEFKPPLPVYPLGTGQWLINQSQTTREIEQAVNGWRKITTAILDEENDLIVIDELSHALNHRLLEFEMVLATLKQKPVGLELVLTGRDMPGFILELADLVTEMKMIKHPYREGFKAREGIEY